MKAQNRAGVEMARARKEKKLTQAELAQLIGASQRTVAAIEGGTRRPSVDMAQRIETELGLPWTRFYESEESEEGGESDF